MNVIEDFKFMHYSQFQNNTIPNPMITKYPNDGFVILTQSFSFGLLSYSIEQPNSDYCYLRGLYVLDEHKKQGYGTKAIKSLIELTKRNKLKAIELEALNDSIDYFKRFGFEVINSVNNRMRLEL
jgi:N-acetylglutamate synthase-like GNAT family acetyltransferase